MARKNVVSFQSMTDADMSGTVTSEATSVKNLDNASFRLFWTSADAEGAFTFEVSLSNKAQSNQIEDSEFFTLDFGAVIPVDMTLPSPDSEHQIMFTQLPFNWLRVKCTPTAGTGTVSAKLTAKQVGG